MILTPALSLPVITGMRCYPWRLLKRGGILRETVVGQHGTNRALRAAVREHKTVFQFGTQQRSDEKFLQACELVRNGRIGELKTINVWSPESASGGSLEEVPVPENVDYDRWLGPAPFKPYTKDRDSNAWWWFIEDYALGFIAGWGIHPLDIALWGRAI